MPGEEEFPYLAAMERKAVELELNEVFTQPDRQGVAGLQHATDALARRNSWQVSAVPGHSVYSRGEDSLYLQFKPGGDMLLNAHHVTALSVDAPDWRGRIGNILRSRWRTHASGDGR